MKKILFIVLLFGAVTASARRTAWDIRLGTGMQGSCNSSRYGLKVGDKLISPAPGIEFLLQPNIGLGDKQKWVFAPTLQAALAFGDDLSYQVSVPLLFGYRIKAGNRVLFVPKVGPFAGIITGYKAVADLPVAGPMLDLAFEFGHFVVGLDAYYSFISRDAWFEYGDWYNSKSFSHKFNPYGMNISFGVKF